MEKRNCLKNNIDDCEDNPKLIWKILKPLITKGALEEYRDINVGSKLAADTVKIADGFNKYLVQSIHDTIATILPVITPSYIQFKGSFQFVDIRPLDSGVLKLTTEQMDNESSADEST